MSFTTILRGLASTLAGLLVLSACVVVEEPRPGPWPGPDPGICTREYDPVCARRGDERRTFANACVAERAGYRSIRPGECRRDGGGGDGPRACTREYNPVCARRGDERRTFSNACLAESAGYRSIRPGECRRDGGGGGGDEPRACTLEYRPVCARKQGNFRTFSNACAADSAGWRVVGEGEC